MFSIFNYVFLLVCMFIQCTCSENHWNSYDYKFKNINREEIYVANATSDSSFKLNSTVENWKSLSLGIKSYTGGISNESMLIIIFSTLSRNGSEIQKTIKTFDLGIPAQDFEFFHRRKYGKDTIMILIYSPVSNLFVWYNLSNDFLNKVESWDWQKSVSHFILFKMNEKNMFLSITKASTGLYSAEIYEFKIDPIEHWFLQSIPLHHGAKSSCITSADLTFFLSIPQSALNQLQIYQFNNNHFISYINLSSPNVDQVVCFENGFQSFVAFNGLDAGIYEFTEDGVKKQNIENSNLQGIKFWLPIPVNIYRDETVLLCQRQIHHDTHVSFDIDVITYNSKSFEEHEDVPCVLFGEQQNSLKCLTEYDQNRGILGSSYIAVLDHLDLILPATNSTSLLFKLNIGIKKIEYPAKKELDSFVKQKDRLQSLIEEQNNELALLIEKGHISSIETSMPKKTLNLGSADSLLQATQTTNNNSNILKLRDEIEQIVREIEELNEKVENNITFKQQKTKFKKIIFNGPVEITGDLKGQRVNTSLVGGTNTNVLLNDIVRKDRQRPINGQKTFTDLVITECTVGKVNGVSIDHFVHGDTNIIINGNLAFEELVETHSIKTTSKLLNEINTENEWISLNSEIHEPLEFDQLKTEEFHTNLLNGQGIDDTLVNFTTTETQFNTDFFHERLFIPGNVTVTNLNKHNFESYLKKLCFKNVSCYIPNLEVKGEINVIEDIKTKHLNGLEFPKEYVSLDFPEEPLIITGLKEFANITRGYKVTTNTVNNIDPNKFITLSKEQSILRNITFEHLESGVLLKVDGNITGSKIETFLPNKGLKDTTNIKSNVYFMDLEVKGNIIVENKFNGADIEKYLQDFVLMDQETVIIKANKTFLEGLTAVKNMHIVSNMINDILLDDIVTKNTEQQLKATNISVAVDFGHIHVKGTFDGENVDDLNNLLVRLEEDETIVSKLVFLEAPTVNHLTIKAMNDINENITFKATKNISLDTILDELDVDVLLVKGNVIGSVNKEDILKEFKDNHLSYTSNQAINEPFYIKKMSLDHINYERINNRKEEFSYEHLTKNVTDFLMYREPNITDLNVKGFVNITQINDRSLDLQISEHIWMKLYRNSNKSITIDGDIYFKKLQIQNLAGTNFNQYIDSLIFKNESDIEITKSIIFENILKVKKIIETETLNDVELENILRKDGKQEVMGPVHIFGNITVENDFNVKNMINNVDVLYILNNLQIGQNVSTIKDDIMFERLAHIRNLIVNGTINGNDFEKMKTSFLYKDNDIDMNKNIVFNEKVYIYGNLGITKDINGVILSDFVSRVAWITQDTEIEGPVKFTRPVECLKRINVEKKLNTKLLFGKDVEEHVRNGVFVNEGFMKGLFNFESIAINEKLNTKFVNDLNMSNIVPLKTDQKIDSLRFSEMYLIHNVSVGKYVNGLTLLKEVKRTIRSNVDQEVSSDIEFLNNVIVNDQLITHKINNKLASKVVTTNTDQNLTALYNFYTKISGEKHLIVHGFVNGINVSSWKNYALSTNFEKSHNIDKKWTVVNDLNLLGPVNGAGVMNGMSIAKLVTDLRERSKYMSNIEKGIIQDYNNLCTDVTYIHRKAKEQIYKFKYFDAFQTVTLPNFIHYVKSFEHQGKHYLLINEQKKYNSRLMELKQDGFSLLTEIYTGTIDQAEIVRDRENLFLVTIGSVKYESMINLSTTVVWEFKDKILQVLTSFEKQDILQESQIPNTFYGLKEGVVTEFKIDKGNEICIKKYRKWDVYEDNIAFFPRGLGTGLALRTGTNVIYLNQNEPAVEDDFGFDTEATISGTTTKTPNYFVPGKVGGNTTVINVGVKGTRKSLLAVAGHKIARVRHRLDIIEVYLDPFNGELFDKISSYRPSSLTSIEFENGETLFAFMEEKKVLQVYEYKGIEGFKHRSSIRIPADQLILMELPVGSNPTSKKILGLVYKNQITLLQAVMVGNKIESDFQCTL